VEGGGGGGDIGLGTITPGDTAMQMDKGAQRQTGGAGDYKGKEKENMNREQNPCGFQKEY